MKADDKPVEEKKPPRCDVVEPREEWPFTWKCRQFAEFTIEGIFRVEQRLEAVNICEMHKDFFLEAGFQRDKLTPLRI